VFDHPDQNVTIVVITKGHDGRVRGNFADLIHQVETLLVVPLNATEADVDQGDVTPLAEFAQTVNLEMEGGTGFKTGAQCSCNYFR
jgi:hypothetical protein